MARINEKLLSHITHNRKTKQKESWMIHLSMEKERSRKICTAGERGSFPQYFSDKLKVRVLYNPDICFRTLSQSVSHTCRRALLAALFR